MNKDELLSLMLRECDVCVHLHGKIPAGTGDFRFTPAQRSTEALLRYISFMGLGVARSMVAGNWDPYQALSKRAETETIADFPAAMERQKAGLTALFAELTEHDLATKTFSMPWGEPMSLGKAMVALPYAGLVAYRMQLFLHAKSAGNAAIGTANCWGGMDGKPPA
jgi:hypothetical protein